MLRQAPPALAAAALLALSTAPAAAAGEGPDIPDRPGSYVSDVANVLGPAQGGVLEEYLTQMNDQHPEDTWVYVGAAPAEDAAAEFQKDLRVQWGLDEDDLLLIVDEKGSLSSLVVGADSASKISADDAERIAELVDERVRGGAPGIAARTGATQIAEELGGSGLPSTAPSASTPAPGNDGVISRGSPAPGAATSGPDDGAPEGYGEVENLGDHSTPDAPAAEGEGSLAPAQGADTPTDATGDQENDDQARGAETADRGNSIVPIILVGGVGLLTLAGVLYALRKNHLAN